MTWSQKLAYSEGQFCLNVPFSFPAFVNPVDKKISKREKIMLNVNSGFGKEILCKSTSHALKVCPPHSYSIFQSASEIQIK